MKFEYVLLFSSHVTNHCKKAIKKLHALARVVNDMGLDKQESNESFYFISV